MPTRDVNEKKVAADARKKVVIVDDSSCTRAWLRLVLENDPRLVVVGEAESSETARQVIKTTNPDVITLDIEMPGMNGLAFLSKLMRLRPLPVVMISGATQSNSEASVTALSLGAVDCIVKPMVELDFEICRDITKRVFAAACSKVQPLSPHKPSARYLPRHPKPQPTSIILLGASTGGVAALETVLKSLNPMGPPVVLVQHMPASFLASFARSLDRQLDQDVAMARQDEPLENGQVRLAPEDGQHTEIIRKDQTWCCRFRPNSEKALYCPSVDALFRSATPYALNVLAAILTGLGRDGADGMLLLHQAGARTFGQDQASSVVYGMPKAAWTMGGVQKQLPIAKIGQEINAAAALHLPQSDWRRERNF